MNNERKATINKDTQKERPTKRKSQLTKHRTNKSIQHTYTQFCFETNTSLNITSTQKTRTTTHTTHMNKERHGEIHNTTIKQGKRKQARKKILKKII